LATAESDESSSKRASESDSDANLKQTGLSQGTGGFTQAKKEERPVRLRNWPPAETGKPNSGSRPVLRPSQYETEFRQVIETGLDIGQSIGTLGLPEQAQSEKSQGVRGTESPDFFNNKLKKTENYASVFSEEVQTSRNIGKSS